jgi:transcriptional regulator with XRE-family HTH domain
MATIGQIVFQARNEAGLSREQLAEMTGLSKGYIADLEQDRYIDISTSTLKMLRRTLPSITCEAILAAEVPTTGKPPPRRRGRPSKSEAPPTPKPRKPKA